MFQPVTEPSTGDSNTKYLYVTEVTTNKKEASLLHE